MINVLIPTKPDDTHAIFVKLALEAKGHEAVLWYTADYPQKQTHSFSLLNDKISWNAQGSEFLVENNNQFDTVWVRRPRKPVISDLIHPDDKENVDHENDAFFKTFWQVIAPDAAWINPINNRASVNCKLQQLKIAAEVGFNTPDTLISNDPEKIKQFINCYKDDEVIYKTLHPMFWLKDQEMRLTYTREIKIEDLPSDTMLQNTPSIFQRKINKEFELRITYLGNTAIAVKLHSQDHARGVMDWRYVPPGKLKVEEFELPDYVDEQCKKFMQKFGIVFGCFDFIVTPDNEYYFLEINEQGQFLWIEDLNPDIKMLDSFVNFLIHGINHGKQRKSDKSVSITEFSNEVPLFIQKATKLHVDPGTLY